MSAPLPLVDWPAPVAEDAVLSELDDPIPCCIQEPGPRRDVCCNLEEHPAAFEALFSCGCVKAYCALSWSLVFGHFSSGKRGHCDAVHRIMVTLISWRELRR